MKHRRCTLVSTDSGSPKARAMVFLGHMEHRTAGVYENQVPNDVLKYLYKKRLIRVEKMYRGGRCTRNVVYLNYDPTPKEEHKPEPYKKRKQMIKDEQLDKECETVLSYKGPMTDEYQSNLIRVGHLLIDRVEQNINFMFDAIKEKKLHKKFIKMEKRLNKKKAEKSWAMYEPAGCYKCSRGQLYSGGGSNLNITYYRRCKCSKVKTKKFKNFLKNCGEMKMKDYNKMYDKFFDNNDHITVGDNATDRSW